MINTVHNNCKTCNANISFLGQDGFCIPCHDRIQTEALWMVNAVIEQRDKATAAVRIARKERDEARGLLRRLIEAKDEKDQNGESPRYLQLKTGLWDEARALIKTFS